MEYDYRALVDWHWQSITKGLVTNPAPLPLCPLKICDVPAPKFVDQFRNYENPKTACFSGHYSGNSIPMCFRSEKNYSFKPSGYFIYNEACKLQKLWTSAFTCFVWISEQTAIISLYSINWLIFTTETECVYCAVRNKYFSTVYINFGL
jgi:hypothetical protein